MKRKFIHNGLSLLTAAAIVGVSLRRLFSSPRATTTRLHFYVGARYNPSDNINLNLQFVTLALPLLLASCASYGPYHPNTLAKPLNSVRGPTDGRYKLAFIDSVIKARH